MKFKLVLIAGALMVAGCGAQARRLEVTGNVADLRFVLVDDNSARSCIDRLTVASAAQPDGASAWRVIAADPAICVTTLRYGEPGAAFGQEAGPMPLRPGVTYRVRASGAGFSVVRDFTATADGVRQDAAD